jgi:hypothetical protein
MHKSTVAMPYTMNTNISRSRPSELWHFPKLLNGVIKRSVHITGTAIMLEGDTVWSNDDSVSTISQAVYET